MLRRTTVRALDVEDRLDRLALRSGTAYALRAFLASSAAVPFGWAAPSVTSSEISSASPSEPSLPPGTSTYEEAV